MVCLDTSGSMMGGREAVAKALTLECLRQAHAQKRPCFLYAFSGPGAVQVPPAPHAAGAVAELQKRRIP